jgi:hypothetical protein
MKLRHPFGLDFTSEETSTWFPFGVGIDVHKDMLWACVLCPDYGKGTQRKSICKFSCDPDGLADMRRWLNYLVPPGHRRFLIESTSTYHFPVIWALSDWIPTIINPKLVGSAKRKTDRWDAQQLAHHSLAGRATIWALSAAKALMAASPLPMMVRSAGPRAPLWHRGTPSISI